MKTWLTLALLLSVLPVAASAQDSEIPPPPCSAPEARQFDFWVGDWNLTWQGGMGTNTIQAILGGCVIQENFDGRDAEGKGLMGMSHSVYSPAKGKWLQTWVDNQGGYLDFEGGWSDGKMILSREASRNGETFLQRMVFQNIEKDAFDWTWERSDDGGRSWTTNWAIHYVRKN